jgi:hypothetical protein
LSPLESIGAMQMYLCLYLRSVAGPDNIANSF